MDTIDRFVAGLDYPMFVLTVPARDGARPSGCLVGFATQCSIAPERFLVCVSRKNHTFRAQADARFVGVHLLAAGDVETAALFGTATGDDVDKFAHCGWTEGPRGVPILERCASWFIGRVWDRVDLGDHIGLVLSPVAAADREAGAPLMFSGVDELEAGHPA